MRILSLFIVQLLVLCLNVRASQIKSIEISGVNLYYHHIVADGPKKGLVLFLHGSVRAFKGKAKSEIVEANVLLEGNKDFIPTLNENGYDIIMPVAFNEFNWLEKNGTVFIDSLLNRYAQQYSSIFIGGFSDGGTGAYRLFYSGRFPFAGAIIFNGYPQLNNFHRTVKYENFRDRKLVFHAQASDKVVPFEFLLTEYRRQKLTNAETYFVLTEGKHEFVQYTRQDFTNLISMLETSPRAYPSEPDSMWVYPPVDGLLVRDSVQKLYHFRNKVCKSYGMKEAEYKAGAVPELSNKNVNIYPLKISTSALQSEYFSFPATVNGQKTSVSFVNYLIQQAW